MTGSKKYFVYTTNAGEDFALLADESNTEALNGATQDFPDAGSVGLAVRYQLPRNVKPRYLVYSNPARTINVKVYALTQTIFNGAAANNATITNPNGGGTLTLSREFPEQTKLPFGIDTGLNDGDAT